MLSEADCHRFLCNEVVVPSPSLTFCYLNDGHAYCRVRTLLNVLLVFLEGGTFAVAFLDRYSYQAANSTIADYCVGIISTSASL